MKHPTEVFELAHFVLLSAQFSFLLEYSSTVSYWCKSVRLAEYDAVVASEVQGNTEVLSHDGSIHLLQLCKNSLLNKDPSVVLEDTSKMWGGSLFLTDRKHFELTVPLIINKGV